jgi:hypothetical protein
VCAASSKSTLREAGVVAHDDVAGLRPGLEQGVAPERRPPVLAAARLDGLVRELAVGRGEAEAGIGRAGVADHERDGRGRPGLVAVGAVERHADGAPHLADEAGKRRPVLLAQAALEALVLGVHTVQQCLTLRRQQRPQVLGRGKALHGGAADGGGAGNEAVLRRALRVDGLQQEQLAADVGGVQRGLAAEVQAAAVGGHAHLGHRRAPVVW